MKVQIKIECDNAAFEGQPGIETARIMQEALSWISGITENCIGMVHWLNDINGNKVGWIKVTR